MKYLTILCLSLGLAGCYGTGPYARIGRARRAPLTAKPRLHVRIACIRPLLPFPLLLPLE